jgi:hypothetical protein
MASFGYPISLRDKRQPNVNIDLSSDRENFPAMFDMLAQQFCKTFDFFIDRIGWCANNFYRPDGVDAKELITNLRRFIPVGFLDTSSD